MRQEKPAPHVPPEFQTDLRRAKEAIECYKESGDPGILDEALAAWESVFQHPAFANLDSNFRLAVLNDYALTYLRRYQAKGHLEDLDRALEYFQQAVDKAPSESPDMPMFLNNLGNGLKERYLRTGNLTYLECAIQVHQQATDKAPSGSPDMPMYLNNFGSGLSDSYRRTGNLADLERAIEVFQKAVDETPPDSPNLPVYLSNLGSGLRYRYRRTENLANLERAIEVFQQAVSQTPDGSPDMPARLNSLATGLMVRYGLMSNLADLERAIEVYEQAVSQTPCGSPDMPMYLSNLGGGLRYRYRRTENLADLERAIELFQQSVDNTQPGSPDLPARLNNLGIGLKDLCNRMGNLADLDMAIEVFQEAVDNTQPGSPDMPMYLNNLGNGLRERYGLTGNLSDLERAIKAFEQAMDNAPPDSPDLPMYLNNLGNCLRERYDRTGDVICLERAIQVFQQALGNMETMPVSKYTCPKGDYVWYRRTVGEEIPECPTHHIPLVQNFRLDVLNDCVVTHLSLYRATGHLENLNQALEYSQQVVSQTPHGSPDLPVYLNNLGEGLRERYRRTGDMADLERAIQAYEQAVNQPPENSPDTLHRLNNLGIGLSTRYSQTGNRYDLERAIQVYERAIQVYQQAGDKIPHGSIYMPGLLNNFGSGLRYRYSLTGNLSELERAIQVYHQAVSQTPHSSPDLPMYLNNLGEGLRERYHQTGDLVDLEQAIQEFEKAVNKTPDGSIYRPGLLNNLGEGLRDHYRRTGNLADLERAIEVFQRAVNQTPDGSIYMPGLLNNLGNGLSDRYDHTGNLEDLEQAIELYQRVVDKTLPVSPDMPMYLNNLGESLRKRYVRTGDIANLERAIQVFQQAVDKTPPGSPDLPMYLNNLGTGLSDRYDHTGNQHDLERAIQAYKQTTIDGQDMAVEIRLGSARNWVNWAFERQAWEEAVQAYDYAYKASEQLVQIQLVRRSKEAWLRESQGLPARAAYARAKIGDLQEAVVSLERGSARLLAEALERKSADLERLNELGHTDLYERYNQAAGRLNRLSSIEHRPDQVSLTGDALTEALRTARSNLDFAIAAIRQAPGYERFLEPPDFGDIQTAVGSNPLVYVAATGAGGLALILRPDITVTPLWLPYLTEGALREALFGQEDDPSLGGYLGAYNRWRNNPREKSARDAWLAALDDTTRWLWQALMGPLVETLSPPSSATIIPAGLLGLLPLHAAWTEEPESPTGRRYALDDVNFTYAPNARALATASAIATHVTSDALLAVYEPRPVKANSLPNSKQEVQTAVSNFAHHRIFRHKEATREAVLSALPNYPVLHFSCHGRANLIEPLDSGLVMANDEFLSLRDLLDLRLAGARLAILSACETGIPGTELPDEVVSLPTGLLQAGVAGVIASLWSVADISTTMLMFRFYDLWRRDKLDPSEALLQAQRWVRDTTNGEKAAYFKEFLPEFSGSGMSSETADALYKAVVLSSPKKRDFSHPYHWAAFSYVGV